LLFFPLDCHRWCFYLDFWAGCLIGMTCREGVWLIYTDYCPLQQGHRYWRVCAYTMSYTSIESISIVAHQAPIMTLQLHVGIQLVGAESNVWSFCLCLMWRVLSYRSCM
jgi:hypothetical protein